MYAPMCPCARAHWQQVKVFEGVYHIQQVKVFEGVYHIDVVVGPGPPTEPAGKIGALSVLCRAFSSSV
jgi:hypothetical protein